MPTASVSGLASERAALDQVVDVLLLIVTGLLGVAVLIALIGVGNTLALSVVERRQENGLLRALGLTRGQVRGLLAWEAALVAGVAAVLGVLLGTAYGLIGVASVLGEYGEVVLQHAVAAGGRDRRRRHGGRAARLGAAGPPRRPHAPGGRAGRLRYGVARCGFRTDATPPPQPGLADPVGDGGGLRAAGLRGGTAGRGVEHVPPDRPPAGLVRADDGDPRHHAGHLRVHAGQRADPAGDRGEHHHPLVPLGQVGVGRRAHAAVDVAVAVDR